MRQLRSLFPPIEPYATHRLNVDGLHILHVEECGNPDGIPIVFLHGGPGDGIWPDFRRYFDPSVFRVVLFDQRGCGKSTPFAELTDNTTWHLVDDIEKVRELVGVDRWAVFGGSWGSTLALCYSQMHPAAVDFLFLRGVWLCEREEFDWLYQGGAGAIFPELYEEFSSFIPEDERGDIIAAYYKRLRSADSNKRLEAARHWAGWEGSLLRFRRDLNAEAAFAADEHAVAISMIEAHYEVNNAFFERDGWLLENIAPMQHIPGVIVHGRYDLITPARSAWKLHNAWLNSKLTYTDEAAHAGAEPTTCDALINALDEYARGKLNSIDGARERSTFGGIND